MRDARTHAGHVASTGKSRRSPLFVAWCQSVELGRDARCYAAPVQVDWPVLGLLLTLILAGLARWVVGRRSTNEVEPRVASAHVFSADRPIADATADRLGRARFSQSVADAIASWQGRDSLVLGLYGQWGSGKTSLVNLVSTRLRETHPGRMSIVDFNPWEWVEHRDIAAAFFGELASAAGEGTDRVQAARLAAAFKAYATFLRLGSGAMRSIKDLYTLLIVVLFAGVFGSTVTGGAIRLIALVLSGAAALSVLATTWSDVFQQLATHLLSKANPDFAAMTEWKHRLRIQLARSNATYLMVIDDLDRLPPLEILRVFQLVKANADFPNLVYLMPFDRGIVVDAIHTGHGGNGNDFLDKIVQIHFNIPYPGRNQIEQLLFEGIDRALAASGDATQRFEQSRSRWYELYQAGLASYIETPRHATRYVASLSFTLSLLTVDGALEVDPVDLIATEILRLFEPDLFEAIANAKDLLSTQRGSRLATGSLELQRARLDALLDSVVLAQRPRARAILALLFPPARELFNQPATGDGPTQWRALLRVCHGDIFDRYFRFDLPTGQVTRARIAGIVAEPDVDRILRGLSFAVTDGLMPSLLKALRAAPSDIPEASRQPFVTALFVVGEDLDSKSPSFLDVSDALNASALVMDVIELLPTSAARAALLREAIEQSKQRGVVYLPAYVVGLLDQRHERLRDALVDETDLQPIETLVAETIHEMATSGALLVNKHLGELMYWWSNWNDAEAKRWIGSSIASARGLVNVLRALESSYRSSTDSGTTEHQYFPFDQIATLVSIDDLAIAALAEREAQLEASGAADPVLDRFCSAVEQWRSGTYHGLRHPF